MFFSTTVKKTVAHNFFRFLTSFFQKTGNYTKSYVSQLQLSRLELFKILSECGKNLLHFEDETGKSL